MRVVKIAVVRIAIDEGIGIDPAVVVVIVVVDDLAVVIGHGIVIDDVIVPEIVQILLQERSCINTGMSRHPDSNT